jgi:peptidoglycan/xylan/chitin deacetylase (PgdA/CDA1 family)
VSWQGFAPGSLYGPARRWFTPLAAGTSTARHVALTYDDGPDPTSTPRFLDLLAAHDVRATFFLVAERVRQHPEVAREIAAQGHELAIHGWTHRCVVGQRPGEVGIELSGARRVVEDLTGREVRWYRPPYGIATVASNDGATAVGLQPVLWTSWGRDWTPRATPASISRTVLRTLRPGGTVLLHDTDAYSAEGSWRATLEASAWLLDHWAEGGLPVGPLSDHALTVRT